MLVDLCRWIHPASGHRCILSLVKYLGFIHSWGGKKCFPYSLFIAYCYVVLGSESNRPYSNYDLLDSFTVNRIPVTLQRFESDRSESKSWIRASDKQVIQDGSGTQGVHEKIIS